MFDNRITLQTKILAETLELLWIGERAKAINSVKFLERKIDERAMFLREAGFVLIAQSRRGHAARIMIAAMQPCLINQRCFLKESRFFFDEADAPAFARQI